MGVLSNKIKKEELKVGDHIYSWRNAYIYSHHGIYVGEEKVIHFTPGAGQEIGTGTRFDRFIFSSFPSHPAGIPCPKCGDQSRLDGGVISSCIDCFLSGGELYLFQYGVTLVFFLAQARGGTCTLATSDPPEDVIHRANFLLLKGFGTYDIFRNNCEDFAVYCKTSLLVSTSISVGRSGQASSFLAATSAVVSSPLRFLATGVSGLAVVGLGTYCASRYFSDIGVRSDAAKVPVERLEAVISNNASAVSVKLDGSNFSVWEPQIKSHLLRMDLMNVMDGTKACPNELLEADATGVRATNPEHKKWISANLFLKSLLQATISPLLVVEVSAYENAAEIWNLFQERYKTLNQSQTFELRGKLDKCHLQQYSKVEEYLQAIKTISGQLTLVNEPLGNIELVLIIIRGLPSEYNSLKTNVIARATTIPIDELCSLILSEEIQIANEVKDSQQAQSTEPPSAYQTTHNSTHTWNPTQSSRGRGGYQNRGGRNGNFGNFGGRFNNFRGGYSGGRNFNTRGDAAKVSAERLEAGVILQQVSNIASAVSVKLDGSNFSVWEPQIKSHLLMDLMNVMDGTKACPNELLEADATGVRATNPEHKKWISANLFLKSLLLATISPLLVVEVSAYENAAEIWNLFQKRYKTLNQSQIFELRGKLNKCHLKQYSKVEEYLQAIKTISGQLTLVNEPLRNIDLVLIIIRGLPSEYNSLKTNVRARVTTIPIDELCSLILSGEIHIANGAKDSQQAQSTEPPSAYQTTHYSTHTGNPTQSSRGRGGYQNRGGRNGNFGNFGGRFNNFRGGYSGGRNFNTRGDAAKVSAERLEAGVILQQVSNIASAVSVKLDGSNFSVWEPQIKSHLLLMDLMNVMDGTKACPNELLEADATGVRATNPEHKKWISANLFLKSLLLATISPLLVFEVSAYENAAEIWNLFQKRYKTLNQSQIFELRGKLDKCHLKQYSKVEEYLQAIKTISGQLTLVNEPLRNIELVLIIIRGLPSEYNSLKTNVRARVTTIPIDELCSLILSEEIHIANGAKDSQQAQSTEPPAYQTTHNSTHTGNPTQSSYGRGGYQNRGGRNGNFGNFGGRFNNFRGGYSGGRNFNTRGGFNGGGRNRGSGGFPGGRSTGYNNNAQTWPPCLVCGRNNHHTNDCFYKDDNINYQADVASSSNPPSHDQDA